MIVVDDELIIRPATLDDLPAVEACVETAYRPYVERMGRPPAPMLADHAAQISDGVFQIAESRGELAGLIASWSVARHWYIDNVAVHPTRRGRGIGRTLLDWASDAGHAHGSTELRLYTNVVMTENLSYYQRLGFVETHRATVDGYERVFFSRPIRRVR